MRGPSRIQGWSTAQQSCSPVGQSCMSCRGPACEGGCGMTACTHSQQQGSDLENCCWPLIPPTGSGARPLGPPEAEGFPCPLCSETIRLWRRGTSWCRGCRGRSGCVSATGSCWGSCCSTWRLRGCRASSGSGYLAHPEAGGCWAGSARWTPDGL